MRVLLLLASSTALGAGLLAPGETQPLQTRQALDEQLEEWRGRCDPLAGEPLRVCLGRRAPVDGLR